MRCNTAVHGLGPRFVPGLLIVAVAAGCGDTTEANTTGASGGDALPLAQDTLVPAVVTQAVVEDSDDPAIWIDRFGDGPGVVLGSDKADSAGGVYVFDLQGRIDRERSVTPLQRINNVDVEYGLDIGGQPTDIAVATERHRGVLRVFSLPEMDAIDGGGIQVFDGDSARAPMGIALYRRPTDGAIFAIVGGKTGPTDGTYLWQYRLEDDGTGTVLGTKVREFGAYSGLNEIEAIAVDDSLGYVYYSDEGAGVRKYHADPDAGNEELAFFGRTGFAEDHEGIAIYRNPDGTGYILVSDQSANRLQVFPREGAASDPHQHSVLAVVPVSAVSTDGIEVTSVPLGPDFPRGLLVMMSDDGTFHYYRWEDVEEAIDAAGGEATGP